MRGLSFSPWLSDVGLPVSRKPATRPWFRKQDFCLTYSSGANRPAQEPPHPNTSLAALSFRQFDRCVQTAAKAAGLGEGFTAHSGRVGMAQDLVKSGVELPALMAAGQWKNSKMPARYTERQAADRGAVARYYQEGS